MYIVDLQNIQNEIEIDKRKVRSQARKVLSLLEKDPCELSVVLCDDKYIKALNRQYLGKDKPTNVISFSQQEGVGINSSHLGDIVISVETAESEARKSGMDFELRLLQLIIHGICHLCGYNHEGVSREASGKMSSIEKDLFQKTK